MRKITNECLLKISQAIRLDVVSLIQNYVPLKPKGANYWALSPFTKEKTPSFCVTPKKGTFKCFSTGISGDYITFVRQMENCGFIDAIEIIAKQLGIELEYDKENTEISSKVESLAIFTKAANNVFIQNRDNVFYEYCKERQISKESIDKFELGFAKNDWQTLSNTLKAKGYDLDFGVQTGCISQKNGQFYDTFRNRLIFPIHNVFGRIVGFGGRILGDKTENSPKYLNSSESELYDKKSTLYGLCFAKEAIRKEGFVRICEGYTDVIAFWQKGIYNVVCSCGTAFTDLQAKLLSRFTRKAVLVFDNDTAGQKATHKTIDVLLEYGFEVNVADLGQGNDPDLFLSKNGKEAYLAAEKAALDFLDFKLKDIPQQANPTLAAQNADLIIDTICKLPNKIEVDLYAKKLAEKLKINENTINSSINRKKPKTAFKGVPIEIEYKKIQTKERNITEIELIERNIIELICIYGDMEFAGQKLIQYICNEIEYIEFENGLYERARKELIERYKQGQGYDLAYLQTISEAHSYLALELHSIIFELDLLDIAAENTNETVFEVAKNSIIEYLRYKEIKALSEIPKHITDKDDYDTIMQNIKDLFFSIKSKQNALSSVKYILN